MGSVWFKVWCVSNNTSEPLLAGTLSSARQQYRRQQQQQATSAEADAEFTHAGGIAEHTKACITYENLCQQPLAAVMHMTATACCWGLLLQLGKTAAHSLRP